MRRISYLCFICLMASTTLVYANISLFHDNLLAYTESTLAVESSFSSIGSIKLAAVHPMVGDNSVTFKAPKATSCAAGYESYNGKCVKKCDRKTYPLASKPDSAKGTYTSCVGATTYYGYTSCNVGWTLKNHDCVEAVCTGYPYDAKPDTLKGPAAAIKECKVGTKSYYKYTSCNAGWDLSGGSCEVHKCVSAQYPYPLNPGESAGSVISCKTGETTIYGYSACNAGWTK
ncbi:MAG: hypothetical protein IJ660_07830, partial [Alphaproteobacteria bacterium]|nr:hypothetical protein [Alphaproteobacteria bacterium]